LIFSLKSTSNPWVDVEHEANLLLKNAVNQFTYQVSLQRMNMMSQTRQFIMFPNAQVKPLKSNLIQKDTERGKCNVEFSAYRNNAHYVVCLIALKCAELCEF